MKETKIILSEKEIPRQWYNISADMPNESVEKVRFKTSLLF